MKITKLFSLLLAITLVLSTLVGCKEEDTTSYTIRVISVLGDASDFEVYNSLLVEYSAENTSVNIHDTSAKSENAFRLGATLASTYASVNAPHIVIYYTSTGIEQLSEFFVSIEEIRELFPEYAANISLAAIKSLDGYAVPLLGQWRGLLVNDEIMAKLGLEEITDWDSFVSVCQMLCDCGYIPIANSCDDCAVFLETLVYGYGGENAVKNGLLAQGETRDYWLRAFEIIDELSSNDYFAPAAQSDEILKYVSQSDLREYSGTATELFNSGEAAMFFVDNESISDIEDVSGCSLISIPLPQDAVNSSPIGGYDIGLYISKKAFENIEIRNTVIELAEYLISESAQERFAQLGYMPSSVGVSCDDAVMSDVVNSFISSGSFSLTFCTDSNRSFWEELEKLCTKLDYNIITPEQAALLWFDPNSDIDELLKETVSDSDVQVSQSDVLS